MSLHPETCLFANSSSSNCLHHGSNKAYVLLCDLFLSPLPRNDDLQYINALWLWCETWASAVLAGAKQIIEI